MNNSSGKTSTILLIAAAALIVLIVIVFIIVKITAVRNANNAKNKADEAAQNEPQLPVYDTTVGDIRFVVKSAQDLGNIIPAKTEYQNNITTPERFIKVTIGAQNKGKVNIDDGGWSLGNIIDSDGRNYVDIDRYFYDHLPKNNACGKLLKPEFDPSECVSYYEVSSESQGLKLEVISNVPKKQKVLLDLNVTQ